MKPMRGKRDFGASSGAISIAGFITILLSCGVSWCVESGPASLAKYDPTFSQACGPVNLYLACRLLQNNISFPQVMGTCKITEIGQSSLLDLKNAAEELGLHASCMKLNATALRHIKGIALLHFDKPKNHFVLFAGCTSGECCILDATRSKNAGFMREIPLRDLRKRWSGTTLLLARDAILLPPIHGGRSIQGVFAIGFVIGFSAFGFLYLLLRLRHNPEVNR